MTRNVTLFIPLFEAFAWFDTGLQTLMTEAGWPTVSRQQTMIMILIRQGCDRPAAIARALGITRQAASVTIGEMIEEGILSMESDPNDRRAKKVIVAPYGQNRHDDARDAVLILTEELSRRIGKANVRKLWDALTAHWGLPVESLNDLGHQNFEKFISKQRSLK